jgi:hypothetical protein
LALCNFPAHVMREKTNACVWNVKTSSSLLQSLGYGILHG